MGQPWYVPKEARLMDPFAKLTPLFWWQTTPCNTKKQRSQFLGTVRILPFAKTPMVFFFVMQGS